MVPVYTAPMRNTVPNLVYAAQGSEVAMVVVDGRVLLEHNRLVTADQDAILADAQRYRAAIGADATEQFWKVNGTNAAFMREEKL